MSDVIKVSLPWPSDHLGQNSRDHWAKKASVTKSARYAAYIAAREEMGTPFPGTGDVRLSGRFATKITLNPPDRKRYDGWNICDRLKASIDGIFDALQADDWLIRSGAWSWGEIVPGGRVTIEIEKRGDE